MNSSPVALISVHGPWGPGTQLAGYTLSNDLVILH